MKAGFAVRIVFLKAILSSIASGFPLENPCLETCNSDADITAEILQTCIEKCMISGDCCGNRLNGEAPHSSNARLSCANGCEIAYYRATVKECKADCAVGNDPEICEYNHPNIKTPFSMCWNCQEGCDGWPDSKACEDGCDFAKELPEFYKYVEKPGGSCDYDDIPRFLFAGQSNMVRSKNDIQSEYSSISNLPKNGIKYCVYSIAQEYIIVKLTHCHSRSFNRKGGLEKL
jgi:hypothetical protein